jgi:hypothetical protein
MLKDSKFKQGIYTPINREKYIGKWPIVYRSAWEFKFMCFLDKNTSIKKWASESLSIPYLNPVTGKPTKYYPDFLYTYVNSSGTEITELCEIKPYKQTIEPKISKNKKKKTILTEMRVWLVNSAKWKFAQEYCKTRNINFRIITEKELNIF